MGLEVFVSFVKKSNIFFIKLTEKLTKKKIVLFPEKERNSDKDEFLRKSDSSLKKFNMQFPSSKCFFTNGKKYEENRKK